MGNGEWGMGNGEWGMGNGEWGMGIRWFPISRFPWRPLRLAQDRLGMREFEVAICDLKYKLIQKKIHQTGHKL
jgi:hypothetical protein